MKCIRCDGYGSDFVFVVLDVCSAGNQSKPFFSLTFLNLYLTVSILFYI